METNLVKIIESNDLEIENADQLVKAFGAPFEAAGQILDTYKSIKVTGDDQDDMVKQAREARLVLKRTRTSIESNRKIIKEDALKFSKAVDGVAKYIKDHLAEAEDYLDKQENFTKYKLKAEQEAIAAERRELLEAYPHHTAPVDLNMSEDEFTELISRLDDEQQKIEADAAAEKKAAEERAAQAERDAAENKRLREEAAKKDAELAAAKAKAEEAERAEKARLQKEADDRQAEKLKAEREQKAIEEAAKRAAAAPDADKLNIYIDNLVDVQLPEMQTEAGKIMADKIYMHFSKTVEMYQKQIDEGLK